MATLSDASTLHEPLYRAKPGEPVLVDVPPARFLAVSGKGTPGDQSIHAQGLAPRGLHHEIYLGDPRRSAPERLRTIVRQGVA